MNPKVAGYAPTWAPFPGYSLLWDNPGDSLRPDGGLRIADADPGIGFYRALREEVAAWEPGRLLRESGFCPLPPSSYHVTAYDGGNAGEYRRCREGVGEPLRGLLDGMPGSWAEGHDLVRPLAESKIARRRDWGISLRYDRLENAGGYVLIVRLVPADAESERRCAEFVAARAALSRETRERFGFGAGEGYGPHVSLAYFAEVEEGRALDARTEEWDARLRARVGDRTLRFDSASVYGFTDMATFFRRVTE